MMLADMSNQKVGSQTMRKTDDRRRGRVRGTEPVPATPAPEPFEAPDFADLRDVLTRRRTRRLKAGLARALGFVVLPTAAACLYFTTIATPLYSSDSAFVIKAGDSSSSPALPGAMSQALPASGTAQDAMTLQVWLESRNALDRLEQDIGFRSLFEDPNMDPVRRLAPNATREDLFRLYARMVEVGFDPSEGVVRLSVTTPDPLASQAIAAALLEYATEQVEGMTRRIRDDRVGEAQATLDAAREALIEARARLVRTQEELSILVGGEEEMNLGRRIGSLEEELSAARIDLATLVSNRRPNTARVTALEGRIAVLEDEIALQRREIAGTNGMSLSHARSEVELAMGEVETRREILTEAMRQLEAARAAAAGQARYVTVSVAPTATDEPSWPQPAQDTGLALMIILAAYIGAGVTASVLREQMLG